MKQREVFCFNHRQQDSLSRSPIKWFYYVQTDPMPACSSSAGTLDSQPNAMIWTPWQ